MLSAARLSAATGMSYGKSRDLVAVGRALRDHLPAMAAAGLAGEVGVEQVTTLAKLAPTTEARCVALACPVEECGEEFLVERAWQEGADGFRRLVRRWAAAVDPAADERGYRAACDRELVALSAIPPSVLARLACDSEISRVVFGPGSQVINAGRAERTFSWPRRKAVIARDGTCRYPGCTAPPALGEIHHVAEWVEDHGETDVNLGILLCWHHHDLVHRLHIEIRRSPTGGWLFLTRHGDPVARAV